MDNAAFWNKAAAKYAKDPIGDVDAYHATLDRMRALLKPDHSVLELGCGTGTTALALANGVARYVGTDVSSEMIAIAQGKLNESVPSNLSFEVQDASTFPGGTHDVVLALNLLHLLPDLEGVLKGIFEALPSGGVFVSKTGLLKDGLWVLPWIIPLMKAIGKAPFVRSLNENELKQVMTQAGFEITETLVQSETVPRLFVVAVKP